jgi:hypothetical protein
MKRSVLGLVASLAFATALVSAQGQATTQQQQTPPPAQSQPEQQPPQTQQIPEVTLQGCLVQGSAPNVFIIENAKKNPDDDKEKAVTYVLEADPADPKLSFRTHLNQSVTVVGKAEQRTPPVVPPGQKVAEKDLLKFTAKTVTMVADRCTPIAF